MIINTCLIACIGILDVCGLEHGVLENTGEAVTQNVLLLPKICVTNNGGMSVYVEVTKHPCLTCVVSCRSYKARAPIA